MSYDHLADFEKARVEITVTSVIARHRKASFITVCEESEKFREKLARLDVEVGAIGSLLQDSDEPHCAPWGKGAEVSRHCELLMVV